MLTLPLTSKEFRAIILSHGYFWLAPTIGTETPPSIIIPWNLPKSTGCLRLSTIGKKVQLETLNGIEMDSLAMATHCLSLDDNIKPLHSIARRDPNWKWLISEKKGRFLRSPSLFEDCCKAILTINIQWKRSVQMSIAATRKFGKPLKISRPGSAGCLAGSSSSSGSAGCLAGSLSFTTIRSFPTPQRLIKETPESLREKINCGFRAKFILSLCDTAIRKPDIYFGDVWREMPPDQFCDEIRTVKGMGPMSVAYVSRLYNKTNSFHMDSWVLQRCAKLWGFSEKDVQENIQRRYGEFGSWGPAVFWFELTRYWHYTSDEVEELGL
jgi:3-methyladenine DNA glycosylase/8-oxoguanine DNA glycosylase